MDENSPQFKIFKKSLDSFNLFKTPKEVHQTNILQSVIQFCDPLECFQSFRVVCKTWKNAVETIRFDSTKHILNFSQDIFPHERDSEFPLFFTKYAKAFKTLRLAFHEIDITKWDCTKAFILNNFSKLKKILIITLMSVPPNFDAFLFTLCQNSQQTLHKIHYFARVQTFPTFPSIVCPNVSTFVLGLFETENFDAINMLPSTVFPNLKLFVVIGPTPNLLRYLEETFSKHFVYSSDIFTLERIPLKFCHLNLEQLTHRRYASSIECLDLHIPNLEIPSEGDWTNYNNILCYFPNLKRITFYYDFEYTNLDSLLEPLSLDNQTIWTERISYFQETLNIAVISKTEVAKMIKELESKSCQSWYFGFN